MLHILDDFLPNGTEKVVVSTSALLAQRGHTVGVAITSPERIDQEYLASDGMPTFVSSAPIRWSRFAWHGVCGPLGQMREYVRAFRPDVIHCHAEAAFACGPTLARAVGAAHINTYHYTLEAAQTMGNVRTRRLFRRLLRLGWVAKADRTVAVSSAVFQGLDKTGLFRHGSLVLVENAVADDLWAHALPSERDWGVAMCGRVTGQKNFAYGVDVLAAHESGLGAEIYGGGTKAQVDALRAHIRGRGLATVVRFSGCPLPHAELMDALRRTRVLFMPSVFEGLSMAALEGLACGAKLVASRIPSFESTFEGVPGVWLVPLDDPEAAARILDDALASDVWPDREALRRRFGLAAQTERLSALYEDARQEGRARR